MYYRTSQNCIFTTWNHHNVLTVYTSSSSFSHIFSCIYSDFNNIHTSNFFVKSHTEFPANKKPMFAQIYISGDSITMNNDPKILILGMFILKFFKKIPCCFGYHSLIRLRCHFYCSEIRIQ